VAALAVAALAAPTSATAATGWNGNHFVNSAGTVECKGLSVPGEGVVLACANMRKRVALLYRSGPASTFAYDWARNKAGFGRKANVISGSGWAGWGTTCRAGKTWVQCENGDDHGIIISAYKLETY